MLLGGGFERKGLYSKAPVWGQSLESRTRGFLPVPVLPCPESHPPPLSPLRWAYKPSGPYVGLPVTIRISEFPCKLSVHRACPLPARCLYAPIKRDLHPLPRPPLIVFLMSRLPGEAEMGRTEAVWSTREPPVGIVLCLSRGLFGRLSPRSPEPSSPPSPAGTFVAICGHPGSPLGPLGKACFLAVRFFLFPVG